MLQMMLCNWNKNQRYASIHSGQQSHILKLRRPHYVKEKRKPKIHAIC